MPHSNQIGMLKEQLRVKSMELKRKDAEKAKQEARAREVIETSRKKLSELQKEIAEKENLILDPILKGQSIKETDSKSLKSKTQTKNDSSKIHQLSKAVTNLKRQNLSLANQIKIERSKRENLDKEKTRLLEEIKRLGRNSDKLKNEKIKLEGNSARIAVLKNQLLKIDRESQESRRKYDELLEEQKRLLSDYEKIVLERKNAKKAAKFTTETNQKLKKELRFLYAEKENLEDELKNNKKLFDKNLAEKIKKVEEEWGKKTKVLRQQKDRINRFSEQVMDEGEAPMWMITYSDMATLLLTFFILYYSIAAQNLGKFKDAILGETETNLSMIELIDSTKIKTSLQEHTGFKPNNILKEMQGFVTKENDLGIIEDNSKIVVRIPGRTLFKPASAVLEKEGWPLLEKVTGVFKNFQNYKIHIQGHTDDDPIFSEKFPTNWELSATRATAVLRFFVDKGLDPKRLTATGYADTFPLSPNYTEQGKAINRRVEFVLEKIKS